MSRGRKHSGRCVGPETKLPSFEKPKYVGKMNNNGHKNDDNSRTHRDEIARYQGIGIKNT